MDKQGHPNKYRKECLSNFIKPTTTIIPKTKTWPNHNIYKVNCLKKLVLKKQKQNKRYFQLTRYITIGITKNRPKVKERKDESNMFFS